MGETTLIFVILLRLLIPFSILRWPILGGFLAIAADASDVMLFQKFGKGPLTNELYHNFDKFFDMYYLTFEFLVVLKFRDMLAKRTGQFLYLWRLIGFAVFELSSLFGSPLRTAFVLAPNIFENFFLAYLIILKRSPQFKFTLKSLIIVLLLTGIPKIIQEYIMHYRFVDQTWAFLRDHFFWWLYK